MTSFASLCSVVPCCGVLMLLLLSVQWEGSRSALRWARANWRQAAWASDGNGWMAGRAYDCAGDAMSVARGRAGAAYC